MSQEAASTRSGWHVAMETGFGCPIAAAIVTRIEEIFRTTGGVEWPDVLAAQQRNAVWSYPKALHVKEIIPQYVATVTGLPTAAVLDRLFAMVWPGHYRTVGRESGYPHLELYGRTALVALSDWGLCEHDIARLYPRYLPLEEALAAVNSLDDEDEADILAEMISIGVPVERYFEERLGKHRQKRGQFTYTLPQWEEVCMADSHMLGALLLWLHEGAAYRDVRRIAAWMRLMHDSTEIAADRIAREGHNSYNIMTAAGHDMRCATTWYRSECLWALTTAYDSEFGKASRRRRSMTGGIQTRTEDDEVTAHACPANERRPTRQFEGGSGIFRGLVWMEFIWHIGMGRYRIFQRAAAAFDIAKEVLEEACPPNCTGCQEWHRGRMRRPMDDDYGHDLSFLEQLPRVQCPAPTLCATCTARSGQTSPPAGGTADYTGLLALWFAESGLCSTCREAMAVALDAWGMIAAPVYAEQILDPTLQARLSGLVYLHRHSPFRLGLAYMWGSCRDAR